MTDAADDRRAAADVAAQVERRRRRADDPDLGLLAGDGPFDVLAHVARHHEVPVDELRRELPDAFALVAYLRRELDRLELGVWRAASRAGMSYQQLADLLDLNSRQAAEQRKRRLEAAVAGEGRMESAARARRRDRAARPDPAVGKDHQVRAVVERLVALADRAPAAYAEDLDDLAAALHWWRPGRATPPEVLADLRILLISLRGETGLDTELGAALAHGAQLVERS